MAVAPRSTAEFNSAEELSPAIDAILGANPFVGLDGRQILDALRTLTERTVANPERMVSQVSGFSWELFKIAVGISEVESEPGDKRFEDPAWSENPIFRRLKQSYLAWRSTMHKMVDLAPEETGDWKSAAQERFAMTLVTEALAPTNLLPGNPAAIKRMFDTGGGSLVHGLRNFLDDLWNNGAMPSQVDKRPFKVGENIGATPGAVVHRSEICEIIQYAPATKDVHARPLLLVPPQINKFYIMDLAPKRSLTEYAVAHGIQFFTVSWRNPSPANRDWGLNDYVGACKQAIGVVCDITGSPDLNLLGVCAGGITSSLLLGHLAAAGDRRVNAATLLVTMLDSASQSMAGMFATEETVAAAVRKSREKGVLDAASMARVFAWLRPNDLVWHYWINNYLLGKDPSPFDILFWNQDSTNLPAALHAGFLNLMLRNPLVGSDETEILGTPVDLRRVTADMYIVAGLTDHICPWQACYRAARLFGGGTEFVLNSSGHIQTLVAAPGNFKAKYYTNSRLGEGADKWMDRATEHKGTWWDHWLGWLDKRSGDKKPAPDAVGSADYPALERAPGTYVFGRP